MFFLKKDLKKSTVSLKPDEEYRGFAAFVAENKHIVRSLYILALFTASIQISSGLHGIYVGAKLDPSHVAQKHTKLFFFSEDPYAEKLFNSTVDLLLGIVLAAGLITLDTKGILFFILAKTALVMIDAINCGYSWIENPMEFNGLHSLAWMMGNLSKIMSVLMFYLICKYYQYYEQDDVIDE